MCFLFKSQNLSCEIWRRKSICRWKLVLRCYSCGTSMSTLACWHVSVGPFLQLHTNSHAIQWTSPYHLSSFHRIINHYLILSIFPPTLALTSSSHQCDICFFLKNSVVFPFSPTSKILQLLEFISELPKNVFRPMVELGLVAPTSPRLEVLLQRESQWPPGTLWTPRPRRRPCTTLAGWGAGWVSHENLNLKMGFL